MESVEQSGVQGIWHAPEGEENGKGVVLAHGAGSNFQAPILVAMARQLVEHGYSVLRCNLAFRQQRRSGPPHPSGAKADRESLVRAVEFVRGRVKGQLILGGHSYGGRQATILASEDGSVAGKLLLFSYPLHPPAKPQQLRTTHFPEVKIGCLFVQGAKDEFGSKEEMTAALELMKVERRLVIVEGAGHELLKGKFDLFQLVGALE